MPGRQSAAHGRARHRRPRFRGATRRWRETGPAGGLRTRPSGPRRARFRRRSPRPRWPCGGSRGWGHAGPGCGIHPWKSLSVVHQGAEALFRSWDARSNNKLKLMREVPSRPQCGGGDQFGLKGLDASADEVGGNVQRPGRADGSQQGVGVGRHGIAPNGQVCQRA